MRRRPCSRMSTPAATRSCRSQGISLYLWLVGQICFSSTCCLCWYVPLGWALKLGMLATFSTRELQKSHALSQRSLHLNTSWTMGFAHSSHRSSTLTQQMNARTNVGHTCRERYPDNKDTIDVIFRVRKWTLTKIACKCWGTAQYEPDGLKEKQVSSESWVFPHTH